MTPLPLLLAAALAAAEVPPPPPEAPVAPSADAASEASPPTPSLKFLTLAAGARTLRFDGIPVTAGGLRAGLLLLGTPRPEEPGRIGIGLFFDAAWGRTENGLATSTVTAGPFVLVGGGRISAAAGFELGTTGIRRATDGEFGFLGTILLRAELAVDLWSFGSSTLFAAVDGSFGAANDAEITALGGRVGLRL